MRCDPHVLTVGLGEGIGGSKVLFAAPATATVQWARQGMVADRARLGIQLKSGIGWDLNVLVYPPLRYESPRR